MKVPSKKSFSLASRPRLSQALCRALPTSVVTHTRTARLLGADNSSGRRRSTRVIRGRIAQVKKSCHKYRQLRRLGVNTRLVAQTAASPKMCYGAEAMGISDSVLHSMRTSMAHMLTASSHGKSPDVTLFANDLQCGTLDPAFTPPPCRSRHGRSPGGKNGNQLTGSRPLTSLPKPNFAELNARSAAHGS